jgi:hypothetical protein
MADKTKEVNLKLDQLLRIKIDLEDSIRKDEGLMRKNNSRPKDEGDQVDLEETKRLYELKLEQLIRIKLAIATANADENNENIYLLSNLNRRRVFLDSLNTFEGDRTTLKSAGKMVKFEAKLSYKKVEKELKDIEGRIRELETKLSDFNHNTEVAVVLYTELNLT